VALGRSARSRGLPVARPADGGRGRRHEQVRRARCPQVGEEAAGGARGCRSRGRSVELAGELSRHEPARRAPSSRLRPWGTWGSRSRSALRVDRGSGTAPGSMSKSAPATPPVFCADSAAAQYTLRLGPLRGTREDTFIRSKTRGAPSRGSRTWEGLGERDPRAKAGAPGRGSPNLPEGGGAELATAGGAGSGNGWGSRIWQRLGEQDRSQARGSRTCTAPGRTVTLHGRLATGSPSANTRNARSAARVTTRARTIDTDG